MKRNQLTGRVSFKQKRISTCFRNIHIDAKGGVDRERLYAIFYPPEELDAVRVNYKSEEASRGCIVENPVCYLRELKSYMVSDARSSYVSEQNWHIYICFIV